MFTWLSWAAVAYLLAKTVSINLLHLAVFVKPPEFTSILVLTILEFAATIIPYPMRKDEPETLAREEVW